MLSLFFFLFRRQRRYLRYLQQDDYHGLRFCKWILEKRAIDTRGSLLACVGILLEVFGISSMIFLFFSYLGLSFLEKNPCTYGKKPLVMTERAKRILWTTLIIDFLICLPVIFLQGIIVPILCLILSLSAPFILPLSLALLSADERKRQKTFQRKAKRRLLEVNPQVIGITGSYGKTTTKHFLSTLLNGAVGPTFHPSKGVNTPMGITREINTRLRDKTPFAVIEMGAYGRGSINRLCRLTPPSGAVFTTIGLAHLERFGSQENIMKAKAELAESVPKSGFLVLNGDDPFCRHIGKQHPKETVLYYGFNEDAPLDLKIEVIKQTSKGTEIALNWKGKRTTCTASLFGKALIANLGAAFTAACHLGADSSYAASMLPHLNTVDNRLRVENAGGITYIHDAYNSNPSGFESALDVLQEMPGLRKILITPGMIELGTLQYSENERLASYAASKGVDMALIVGTTNQLALQKGLSKTKNHLFKTRDEAFAFLKSIREEGDVILIENDLPDLYEAAERF